MLSELFRLDKIMDVCEKILYFFVVNLLFVFTSLPLLLFLLFVGADQIRTCLPLFLVCMIPEALSLSGVLYAMNRLVRGLETKARVDFKKGYFGDAKIKLSLGAIQAAAILITWTNVEFFTKQMPFLPLVILFGILFAFTLVLTPNLYLLASRYQMGVKEILKTAAILTIVRPINTLGTLAALGIVLMTIELSPSTAVLFMGSVYGFLVTFMAKRVLAGLEG